MAPKAIAFGGLVWLIAGTGGLSHARPAVRIESVSVKAEVIGGLARSRVTYAMRNHSSEEDEGDFELELPPEAALLQLAMDTRPGEMMEGEIENPAKARGIYEQIVASKRDPALLEHIDGDRYRLRAFPVPPRETKTVLLVFDHRVEWVGGERRYELAMPISDRRPSRVRRVSATLRVDGRLRGRVRETNSAAPIELSWRPARDNPVVTARINNETWFAAELLLPGRQEAGWRHLVAAVDTSSSVDALAWQRARAVVDRLIAETPADGSVEIVFGATRQRRCTGPGSARCLDRAKRGGGTDLDGLLRVAATSAARRGAGAALVLLTDGVATVGQRSAGALGRDVAARLARSGARVLAVDLGPDNLAKRPVVELASAAGGAVVAPRPGRVVRALAPIAITELDAGDHIVSTREAPEGTSITIAGKLAGGARTGVVEVRGLYRGRRRTWRLGVDRSAPRSASVEGVWVQARLRAMEHAGASTEALAQLAKAHGVAGVGSSMLVLESEQDYKRWAIARTQGPLRAARDVKVPTVRIGCSSATGDIDKYLVRRTMRSRRRQIRHCYNRALMRRPGLEGTIVARLLVQSGTGELASSQISSSSLGDAAMEACVARQLSQLRFPVARGGGAVAITYPFHFRPPPPSAVDRAIARHERILELEAGEANVRRAAEIAELVALHAAEGDRAAAARALRLLERELRRAGRSPAELLAALPTSRLREQFGATFRRAARARLSQPAPPTDLFVALFDSALHDQPGAIAGDFERFSPGAGAATHAIDRLVGAGHERLAATLLRAWRTRGRYSDEQLYDALAQKRPARALPALLFAAAARVGKPRAFDDLVATASTFADRRRAARIVRHHCKAVTELDDPCFGWLDKLAPDPSAARHRDRLLRAMLAAADRERKSDPESPWIARERAGILERLGRLAESLAIVGDLIEAEPDDDELRDRYVRLRRAVRNK